MFKMFLANNEKASYSNIPRMRFHRHILLYIRARLDRDHEYIVCNHDPLNTTRKGVSIIP